jgi:hypothetical protein
MPVVTTIDYTLFADNLEEPEHANEIAGYMQRSMEACFPAAEVTVEVIQNTQGVEPAPYIETEDGDWPDQGTADMVRTAAEDGYNRWLDSL